MIRADGAGARAGRLQGARKIREGELGDAIAESLSHHFVIESAHGLADLCQQATLGTRRSRTTGRVRRIAARFVRMCIKPANVAEEYLTPVRKSQIGFDLQQRGDLAE